MKLYYNIYHKMSAQHAIFTNTTTTTTTIDTNTIDTTTDTNNNIKSFEDMSLKDDILRAIYAVGYETPSDIQKTAIPAIMKGKDVIAQAYSGTGKTAAFGISALQITDENIPHPQVLILTTTKELAQQHEKTIKGLGSTLPIKIGCFIGGTRLQNDIEVIKDGVQIIIGTSGRIFDLFNRKIINPTHLKLFILDEADKLLSENKYENYNNKRPVEDNKKSEGPDSQEIIRDIITKYLNEKSQIILFSATYTPQIINLADNFMNNPVKILLEEDRQTLDGIKQYAINIDEDRKDDLLLSLYSNVSVGTSVTFFNSVRKTEAFARKLKAKDYPCHIIHGQMSLEEREYILTRFRSGEIRILLATDVIGRGIDIQQLSMVINIDVPNNKEDYLHRIGRSGRFGRKGTAINFISNNDTRKIADIMSAFKIDMNELSRDFRELKN